MQRRYDAVAEVVLDLREALRELPHVVVVDERHGGHDAAAGLPRVTIDLATREIPQGLRPVRIAAPLDEAIEALEQLPLHRHTEANEALHGLLLQRTGAPRLLLVQLPAGGELRRAELFLSLHLVGIDEERRHPFLLVEVLLVTFGREL